MGPTLFSGVGDSIESSWRDLGPEVTVERSGEARRRRQGLCRTPTLAALAKRQNCKVAFVAADTSTSSSGGAVGCAMKKP